MIINYKYSQPRSCIKRICYGQSPNRSFKKLNNNLMAESWSELPILHGVNPIVLIGFDHCYNYYCVTQCNDVL